ncbi:unnamed protein product [Prorocentrum cordatum]|uniref:Uncharacterized protein n=1 Tax=Prorocentrum cordatum TaxID=2364126 RepID=A0ABN9SQV2_9DINO|nr:unnamed protein product [Polarella glacialis]
MHNTEWSKSGGTSGWEYKRGDITRVGVERSSHTVLDIQRQCLASAGYRDSGDTIEATYLTWRSNCAQRQRHCEGPTIIQTEHRSRPTNPVLFLPRIADAKPGERHRGHWGSNPRCAQRRQAGEMQFAQPPQCSAGQNHAQPSQRSAGRNQR